MSKYITLEIGISGWREYIFFLIICTAFRVVQPFGASATAIGRQVTRHEPSELAKAARRSLICGPTESSDPHAIERVKVHRQTVKPGPRPL
jgi:hypothetical protein